MRIPVIERIAGTTITVFWTNSGSVPSAIISRLLDRDETMVNCMTAVASGNGHFFALHHLPSSYGSASSGHLPQNYWMVNEWTAVINANTYRDRQFVKATLPNVS